MEKHLTVLYKEADSTERYDVLSFVGELDKAGLAEVRDFVSGFAERLEKDLLVFDFGAMKFTNSEGIGFIMEIFTHLKKEGKNLVVVGANAHVMDVFKTIGLTEVVKIIDSISDL